MDRFVKLTFLVLAVHWPLQIAAENYQGLFLSGTPRIHELERKGLETTSTLSFAKDHYGRLWMG